MNGRKIWVRGLTPSDRGKVVTVDGKSYLLRGATHFDKTTTLTVVTEIELPNDAEVEVHDV
jgi:hypothetical protein